MALAEVQGTSGTAGTTTTATATNANNVASSSNSLILVTQAFGPTNLGPGTVADTFSGTWTLLANLTSGTKTQFTVWVCNNPQAAQKHAVTWTLAAASSFGSRVWLSEFSGGPLSYDVGGYLTTASGTSESSATINPATNGELVMATVADATGSSVWTIGGSFTTFGGANPNTLSYQIQATAAPISATWTIAPADSGDTAIFALTASSNNGRMFAVL